MAEPYPKEKQLARGERRKRRYVASTKEWLAIIESKGRVCRLSEAFAWPNSGPVEYHHLVPRSMGGDDVADNIVPLCRNCHKKVTHRAIEQRRWLAESLSPAERAYVVGKLGEGALARLFGV